MNKVVEVYIRRDIFLKGNLISNRNIKGVYLILEIKSKGRFEDINILEAMVYFQKIIGQKFCIKVFKSRDLNNKLFNLCLKVNISNTNKNDFFKYYSILLLVGHLKKYGYKELVFDEKLGYSFEKLLLKLIDKNILYKLESNLDIKDSLSIILEWVPKVERTRFSWLYTLERMRLIKVK